MITLELNKELYTLETIKEGIKVYSGFAAIAIHEKDGKWVLRFRRCTYQEDITIKEFENYLIGLENR